jgi:hypothetical protein
VAAGVAIREAGRGEALWGGGIEWEEEPVAGGIICVDHAAIPRGAGGTLGAWGGIWGWRGLGGIGLRGRHTEEGLAGGWGAAEGAGGTGAEELCDDGGGECGGIAGKLAGIRGDDEELDAIEVAGAGEDVAPLGLRDCVYLAADELAQGLDAATGAAAEE